MTNKIAKRLYFSPHLVDENLPWDTYFSAFETISLDAREIYYPKENELIFVQEGVIQFFCTSSLNAKYLAYNVGRKSFANITSSITGTNRYIHFLSRKAKIVCVDVYKFYGYEFIEEYPELMLDLTKNLVRTTTFFTRRTYRNHFQTSRCKFCETISTLTRESGDKKLQNLKLCLCKILAHLVAYTL